MRVVETRKDSYLLVLSNKEMKNIKYQNRIFGVEVSGIMEDAVKTVDVEKDGVKTQELKVVQQPKQVYFGICNEKYFKTKEREENKRMRDIIDRKKQAMKKDKADKSKEEQESVNVESV